MKSNNPSLKRFGPLFIVQHIVLLTSVLLLILSGVPLKFPNQAWAHWLVWLQGGMQARALIHHTAGQMLVLLGVFHFIVYLLVDRRTPLHRQPILIRPSDAVNFWHHLLYVLGRRERLPRMGRYTWYEKFDYIGLMWGIGVMGATGLSMLYMDVALRLIPLSWLQVLWAAHSEEAMLATLFLLVIHMYHVHFNPEKFPMSLTWLNGKISREEMEKYHPLELEEIERAASLPEEPAAPLAPLADPLPASAEQMPVASAADSTTAAARVSPLDEAAGRLDRLQRLLERINTKAGSVGAVLAVLFWLVILSFAILHMLENA